MHPDIARVFRRAVQLQQQGRLDAAAEACQNVMDLASQEVDPLQLFGLIRKQQRIERGDASVSLGHNMAVLSVLGLADDVAKAASDEELGRKLQDIKLLGKRNGR